MSRYRYRLRDYHAVQSAEIAIDGITVLAGENGCGKSTLSRWLYYLVNGSRRFDEFVYDEYRKRLREMFRNLELAFQEFYRSYSREQIQQKAVNPNTLRQISRSLGTGKFQNEQDIIEVYDMFVQFIHQFSEQLEEYLNTTPSSPRRSRVLAYLKLDADAETETRQIVENFVESNLLKLQRLTEGVGISREERPLSKLLAMILENYEETDAPPKNIQLYEDDVELVNGSDVSILFNLQRAIYVDTPMALMNDSSENVYWNELRDYILDKGGALDLPQRKIIHRIKNILQGEARMVEDDSPFAEDELRFVSADQLIDIEIEKTATGFKTFAYLLRLLENGYLNDETLLLIDEPEVHLHPQWIVEYARLLVLLNKELGLKIMLASHNPDMVAALRAIAEKESVLSTTHFYLAEASDIPHQYNYKDLGSEIGEIFSSFNIALSRINAYGNSGVRE